MGDGSLSAKLRPPNPGGFLIPNPRTRTGLAKTTHPAPRHHQKSEPSLTCAPRTVGQ